MSCRPTSLPSCLCATLPETQFPNFFQHLPIVVILLALALRLNLGEDGIARLVS